MWRQDGRLQFEYAAGIKSSVDAIAMKLFNNCHKLRQRRGTMKCAKIAFYDRKPGKDRIKTVFGKDTVTHSIRATFELGCYTIKGHIVFMVNQERQALVTKSVESDDESFEIDRTGLTEKVKNLKPGRMKPLFYFV